VDKDFQEDYRSAFDEVVAIQRVIVISGSLGPKIEIETLYAKKGLKIERLRK
jgi:hypothetical protein